MRILICVQGQGAILPNRGGPPGLLDIAVAQAAVHDAVQAHQGRFESYHYDNPALRGIGSPEAAAAAAAYGILVGLYGAANPCLVGVEIRPSRTPATPGCRQEPKPPQRGAAEIAGEPPDRSIHSRAGLNPASGGQLRRVSQGRSGS